MPQVIHNTCTDQQQAHPDPHEMDTCTNRQHAHPDPHKRTLALIGIMHTLICMKWTPALNGSKHTLIHIRNTCCVNPGSTYLRVEANLIHKDVICALAHADLQHRQGMPTKDQ